VETWKKDDIFFISSFKKTDMGEKSLSDYAAGLSLSNSVESKSEFCAYTRADAIGVVENALQVHLTDETNKSVATSLKLSMSPGQELFLALADSDKVELPIHKGVRIRQADLNARKVRPVFNSFPVLSVKPVLLQRLRELGYQLMNNSKDRPDSFTIVHLLAEQEKLFAKVTLAVDHNLQELSRDEDPRLSEEKSKIVEQILKASTLGEVLPGPTSLKMKYRSLCLQVNFGTSGFIILLYILCVYEE
jgi:hypothetical protein